MEKDYIFQHGKDMEAGIFGTVIWTNKQMIGEQLIILDR